MALSRAGGRRYSEELGAWVFGTEPENGDATKDSQQLNAWCRTDAWTPVEAKAWVAADHAYESAKRHAVRSRL